MDPFVGQLKGTINSVSQVISLADDLDGVAKQVQDLGKKELAARREWRRKQTQVNGDYSFLNAVDEYHRVKEAVQMREQVKKQVIQEYGKAGWEEVERIEKRQKEEFKQLYTEDGHDKQQMFQLKLACFGLAFFITMILYLTGMIREMSIAFYGA